MPGRAGAVSRSEVPMEIPLQIAYRNVEPTPRLEQLVRRHARRLERFFGRITSCRVSIALPTTHHREGTPYDVRIDLTVPGREIVVSKSRRRDERHVDLEFAVDDAFQVAKRMLGDYVREIRGVVKDHATPPHGRVVKWFPESGYGFIETADGGQVHFDLRSVIEGADRIERGAEVRYVLKDSTRGPNATSVRLVGRHRHIEPVLAPSGGGRRSAQTRQGGRARARSKVSTTSSRGR
jgi:cold shock CspA family protein